MTVSGFAGAGSGKAVVVSAEPPMDQGQKAIRLLIYSHYFWPSIGGVETYVRLLARGVAEDPAFTVTVVTHTANLGDEPAEAFRVIRLPSLWRLWRLITSADVVLLAGPCLAPMAMAMLARKPLMIEHHGYQAVCLNGLLLNKFRGGVCPEAFRNRNYGECLRCGAADGGRLRAVRQLVMTLMRNRLCRRAFAHVAVSHHVRKRHNLENMRVIYHGLPKVDRMQALGETLSCRDEVHFGYVGRLVEEKGLPLLVEAAARLKSAGLRFRLSFIGGGPLRNALEAQVAMAGLKSEVRFEGCLEGRELQRAVEALDVTVMPSVWEETAGLAAIEQMMRGRVVLAADIGGLGEMVGDGGVKFRAFDSEDLASKMTELACPELRLRVSAAGRARADRLFCLERMVREHKELFREAARGNGRVEQGVI